MHEPRPYGLLVTGEQPTELDQVFIDSLARHLTNLKNASTVESLRLVRSLPDGGYVIAQDVGGNFRIVVNKKTIKDIYEHTDGLAKLYVPMLFSGVIKRARVRENEGVIITLTEQCRRRLINYSKTDELPLKTVELIRFVIPINSLVSEFEPRLESQFISTQYVQQRPTWYSGAMAEIMQIVGGYGIQPLNEQSDDLNQRLFKIPAEYLEKIADELDGVRLPGYSGLPPSNGQFQFDYKFLHTNGVSFDESGSPWLLRISPSGVWAMPLPMIPVTCTDVFKEYVEEQKDTELLAILERFGGVPSGETFPEGTEFEIWRRAGVISRVCTLGEFYANQSYSDTFGWSLNTNGTEAINTCYTSNDRGISIGKTYLISLKMGIAENSGNLNKVEIIGEDALLIGNYLEALISLLDENSAIYRGIMYKLRRVDKDFILSRVKPTIDENEVLFWDSLELEPIAQHSGHLVKIDEGFLYHSARPENQPQFKVPNVFLGGCISFDFGAYEVINDKPNCNTIMFACFEGNELKVVKYFADWRTHKQEIDTNYENIMQVGSWYKKETTSPSQIAGHFYTTYLDMREDLSASMVETDLVGLDLGYDSIPRFAYDGFFYRTGILYRNRYYSTKVNTKRSEGISLNLAVCIPYLCRNESLIAYKKTKTEVSYSESVSVNSVQDPTSYQYYTNDSIFAWVGSPIVSNGRPYPVNGNPVWAEYRYYNPNEYNVFADNGSWLPGLPNDITWLVHPKSNEWKQSGGGGAPTVLTYSKSWGGESESNGSLNYEVFEKANLVYKTIPQNWYFSISPSVTGDVFYKDGCKVTFGESQYANISEIVEGSRKRWGYTSLVDHGDAHHFIGVINE